MALRIEDYAVVGDTSTVALIGRDGSVDWCCFPRFDSAACFAALLGDRDNGRWLLGPEEILGCSREYEDESAVLVSTYTTPSGRVRVTDVMPLADHHAGLVRRVEGLEGTVTMRHEWIVRFGYGRIKPWVRRRTHEDEQVITAVAGPDRLMLRGPRLPHAEDGHHVDTFPVRAGETLTFSVTWSPSHLDLPAVADTQPRIEQTVDLTRTWVQLNRYQGPYRAAVSRSLLTLRLLTHSETGGIVAAPTTSLPEEFGGERNWDYRFCWLRDAAMTLGALLRCGYQDEVRLWRDWLLRAVAGDPEDLQIMYGVDGGRELPERTLGHLGGYEGALPVRVGNGAVTQRQNDVIGEVMNALAEARRLGVEDDEDSWSLQVTMVEYMCDHWRTPDNGIWEIRGPARHFTHSKALVWVALDRAIEAVERHGLDGPVERWRSVRDEVRADIFEHGLDPVRGCFTQHYETTEVDASLLLLSRLGLVEGDHPVMLGTIAAVEADLTREGLVRRYRTESDVDGLSGDENPFLACSFWLVSAYARAGRTDDARALMQRLLALGSDLGLYAEEYDPVQERFAGNFPQALSHLSLIGAALDLDDLEVDGPRPAS